MKLSLTDENWIDVIDPRKLPQWRADAIEDAQMAMMAVPEMRAFMASHAGTDLNSIDEAQVMAEVGLASMLPLQRNVKYTTILNYVREWSFGEVTREVLLELPKSVVVEIDDRLGVVIKATGGTSVDAGVSPDPDSPTQPSSD